MLYKIFFKLNRSTLKYNENNTLILNIFTVKYNKNSDLGEEKKTPSQL